MTEREAMEIIMQVSYDGEFPMNSNEAFGIACKALELLTPKKPIYIEVCDEPKKYSPECPFCHEEVEEDASHCDNCLQRLDWSVEE